MELKEIEPRNLTDKIVESISEAETDTYVEPKYTHTPETEVEINTFVAPIPEAEAELLLKPEPINRPISATDRQSIYETPYRQFIYETPYSTRIYHNCGGTRVPIRNSSRDESGNIKWSLSCLIIGVLIGLGIGATVTGLSMHFTKTPIYATLPTTSPMVTTTTPPNTFELGESNSLSLIEYLFYMSHNL